MGKKVDFDNLTLFRKKAGKNQQEFWGELGVTQSGGSRYEHGRDMPKPVRKLLKLKYEQGIKVEKV